MKEKRLLKYLSVILSLALMLLAITACGDSEKEETEEDTGPVYADHTVKVVDTLGNPISDVIVRFVAEDGATKMKLTNEEGIALYANGLVGNFKIELEEGGSDIVADGTVYEFEEGSSSLVILIRNDKNTMDIYGDNIPEGGYAGVISAGEYNIPEGKSGLDYYVFSAKTSGTYKVSVISENSETSVGYYGNPMVVRSSDIYAGKNDGKGYELVVQESGTPYVIGVDRADNSEFTLKVERIGDAPFDPAYAPWNNIASTEKFEVTDLPYGTVLCDLDVTDKSLSVTLGSDGRYYTNDGRLVYIRITSASKYWETELARLVGQMDNTSGINFGGYVYDDEGNFVDKYSYNSMIISYIPYCDDESGVYPLTEELANAIKHHGENTGWWNTSSINYLFADYSGVVTENAWLFVCCVIDEPVQPDTPANPDTPTEPSAPDQSEQPSTPTMDEVVDRLVDFVITVWNDIKNFFE